MASSSEEVVGAPVKMLHNSHRMLSMRVDRSATTTQFNLSTSNRQRLTWLIKTQTQSLLSLGTVQLSEAAALVSEGQKPDKAKRIPAKP